MNAEKLMRLWNQALWVSIPATVLGGAVGFFFDVVIQGSGLVHAYAPASLWVALSTGVGFAVGSLLASYTLERGQEERFEAFQKQVTERANKLIQAQLGDYSK